MTIETDQRMGCTCRCSLWLSKVAYGSEGRVIRGRVVLARAYSVRNTQGEQNT